jgi:hypothetical protein
LEPIVCDPAQTGVDTLGGQICLLGLVDDDEGGFAVVDNVEFVLVEGREAPLRLHGLNYLKVLSRIKPRPRA